MKPSAPQGNAGLPMTSKWDPAKLEREIAELQALEGQPFFARAKGYLKRTGPGLLQSAMTLGAGSAVASVVAGASFGYELLWVQPVAMFLGVCMLAALGNVVLTKGERPYHVFGRELHPLIPWLWAVATIVASVIWHFPQYGLAAGAARDLADLFGVGVYTVAADGQRGLSAAGYGVSFGIGFLLLGIGIFTTWNYGSRAKGIKIYEWFLRGVIALVIVAFATVVVATGVKWGELFRGFFAFRLPSSPQGIQTVLGAIGAAVGINMTFLYGYSLLAKGWGQHHKKLSRWDLGMSMFLPFVVVTSLIIIAMANTIYNPALNGAVRTDLRPVDAAQALVPVMGANLGRLVFNLGFIAMTCGAISAHMVVCGFTMCEMFKLEYTVWRYRLFTLVPVVGLLGVVTSTPLWLPVVASAICFTMLPIAYLTFLIMNNRRRYLGAAVGGGWKRAVFNILLAIAVAMSVVGAGIQVKTRVIDKLPELFGKRTAQVPTKAPAATPGPARVENAPPFLAVYIHFPSLFDAKASPEIREQAIARELDRIQACGLDTLLPYATGTSGSAAYASDIIPDRTYGDWDPLAVLMREARRRGLRVFPVHCPLPSGGAAPRGILLQHPDWALRNAKGEPLGHISPLVPAARQWVASVSRELVTRYQPDGLLLDYLRFPSEAVQLDGVPAPKDAAGKQAAQARKEEALTELARLISTTARVAKPGLQIALYSWGPHVTTNHPVAQNWPLWAQRGYVDQVNISGYCFTNNYGARYRDVFARRIREAVALNHAAGSPAQVSFALGVKTSHGQIHRADEVADYLTLARAEGANGVAVFTWGHLQPFYETVRTADSFRKFAALPEPAR